MARLDLDAFANSRLGLRVAAGIGRTAPPVLGAALASTAAHVLVAGPQRDMVRAVRSNQWVASGYTLTGDALDELARRTFEHMARSVYDVYHLQDQPRKLLARFATTPAADEWLDRGMRGEPVILAAGHLSNFELAGRALALRGVRAQVLSVPDPTDAYRQQNEERRDLGFDVTPISLAAIRSAEERLRTGGIVITGVDRPAPGVKRRPRFFGRPSELPVLHARLALRTGAHLIAFVPNTREDGVYELDCLEVGVAPGHGDEATLSTAEALLAVMERAIQAHPEQWAMPHAVWPEAIDELDAAEGQRKEHTRDV